MLKTIKFTKTTWRDSLGRNGFVQTTGVEIYDASVSGVDLEGRENCIIINPITSRGKSTEAARISIAKSALPEVIAALRELQGESA